MALTPTALAALPINPDTSVAEAGKDTLLSINTGTTEVPVWTVVGGQRNAPVDQTASSLDGSHKTSGGWAQGVPGIRSWKIDYTGLQIMSDSGLQALEYAFRNSKQLNVQIQYTDKSTQVGWCYVTAFSRDNGHDAIATVKCTLTGVGAIGEVTAAGA